MYAIIGLFSLIMMYYYALEMGNYTYLIQDLFFSLVLGLAISYTPPVPILSKSIPPERLFTRYFCFKLISQLLACCTFQVIALEALAMHKWYHKFELGDAEPVTISFAYETSVIADMGLAQIMIASVVSTIDKPYRLAWYTNKIHMGAFVVQTSWLAYQIFGGDDFLRDSLDIKTLPKGFALELLGIIAANWIVCLVLLRCADYFCVSTRPLKK
jgi:cation-transporting P-type ATPase 13A2